MSTALIQTSALASYTISQTTGLGNWAIAPSNPYRFASLFLHYEQNEFCNKSYGEIFTPY